MEKGLRKPIIAGNWKMNHGIKETIQVVTALRDLVKEAECEILLAVPFTDIAVAMEAAEGSKIEIAAQNCHWAESGAFTGEISAKMLRELGVMYTLTGHSERRQYFGETDETVNGRTKAALSEGIRVIVCVGETLEEREKGITEEVCKHQTIGALAGISKEEMKNIVIAYEPVWAIGTGKTATADEAAEVCKYIRGVIGELYDEEVAKALRVQYGGSMNGKNAAELLSKSDIDGGLIGGASLKAADFAEIISFA